MTKASYQKTETDSGIKIVSERIPSVRSVSVGIWIATGSINEDARQAGISHMLEHMIFKGTKNRSGFEIVQTIEGVGGHINAFTSKELTCYYAQVLDEHLELALDILCDLITSPTLSKSDIEKEKLVITEEIRHYEDAPNELIFDYFAGTLYGKHPLARPIMGSVETVSSLTQKNLKSYIRNWYTSDRIIFAGAGNLKHDDLVKGIKSRLHQVKSSDSKKAQGIRYPAPRTEQFERPVQGAHLCRGVPGVRFADERKFAALVLSNLIGGGMSSRLFQRVREKEALAYSIFSFLDSMHQTGVFGIYLGTDPNRLEHTMEVLDQEYQTILNEGIPADELTRTKEQLKGNLVLALESTSGRMFRLAKLEIYLGQFLTIDDTISLIDEVSEEKVMELARVFLDINKQYTAIILPKEEHVDDHRSPHRN